MKNNVIKEKHGFTLLEVILAAVLGSLILISTLEVYIHVWDAVKITRERFIENSELQKAVYYVTHDLRRAEAVEIPAPDKLIIKTFDSTIMYELKNEALVRTENNQERITAEGITAVYFSLDNYSQGNLITIKFRGQKKEVVTGVWIYTKE